MSRFEDVIGVIFRTGGSLIGETACLWLLKGLEGIHTLHVLHRTYPNCMRLIRLIRKMYGNDVVVVIREERCVWECSVYPDGALPFYVRIVMRLPPLDGRCSFDIDRIEVSKSDIRFHQASVHSLFDKVFKATSAEDSPPSGALVMRAAHLLSMGWKMHQGSAWRLEYARHTKCEACGESDDGPIVYFNGDKKMHYHCFIIAYGIDS